MSRARQIATNIANCITEVRMKGRHIEENQTKLQDLFLRTCKKYRVNAEHIRTITGWHTRINIAYVPTGTA